VKLTKLERRLAARVFDALLPPGASTRIPLSGSEAGLIDWFEEHLGYLPIRTRLGLRAAIGATGVWVSADRKGAIHSLDKLASSRLYLIREIVTLVKSVVCMGYFVHPSVRAEMGLDLTLPEAKARS
jgi:hypothetical protein